MNHPLLPAGWRRNELGDLVSFSSGGTPSRERAEYWNGEIPWVTAKDMKNFELHSSQLKITSQGLFSGGHTVPANSILVLVRGMTLLKDVPVCLTAREVAFNQDVRGLRVNGNVDARFLAYALVAQRNQLRGLVDIAGHGTGRLATESLSEHPVAYPAAVSEQKAIAAVLSTWDRAIGQTTALIAAKERLKEGRMQQLLTGKRRRRGSTVPWKKCHLGNVFTERREQGNNDLPLLSVTLNAGVVRRTSLGKPVRTSLEHEEHLLVRRGDIAYNMMRMWQGGSGMVGEDGVVSPAYVVCAPTKEIDSRFAHHLFHSPRMIYLFWAYSYGLTDDRRRLYYEEFARVPVNLPSVQEQKRIAALIDNLDRERFLLMRRRAALAHQKRGLMQKLLTGKVRVSESLLKMGATT